MLAQAEEFGADEPIQLRRGLSFFKNRRLVFNTSKVNSSNSLAFQLGSTRSFSEDHLFNAAFNSASRSSRFESEYEFRVDRV